MSRIYEETFYTKIKEWLNDIVGCHYTAIRKFLWGRQPDVIGIRFIGPKQIKVNLYLVEVKIIDSLSSAYNAIGELEVSLARFKGRSSVFNSLYPYLAIFENVKF